MIYKMLEPKRGIIQVGKAYLYNVMYDFEIVKYDNKWAKIHIFENDVAIEEHSIPTFLNVGQVAKTGGNRYKLVKQVEIVDCRNAYFNREVIK